MQGLGFESRPPPKKKNGVSFKIFYLYSTSKW